MACLDAEAIAELLSEQSDPSARAAFADHAAACESCHAVALVLFERTQTTARSSSDPDLPSTIDRYVVRRKLGAGGMGVVYVAHDPELNREVAIKMLRPGVAASRLRREARSLARLSHPNVVAVHDVGEHDGQVFVAMALVDGVDLRQWLRETRETREIRRVLRDAGRGIVAAHTAGLIHRDLKPDNIFIASSGEVRVGDFGLARDSDEDGASLEGTAAYMPPEQAEGHATERSDQFSFCVTAFEALYGQRPFAGANLEELVANVNAGRIVEVRSIDARVDRALRRGLAADPAQRFDSMSDLLRELEPRSRRGLWLAAAGVLVVGAAVATTVILRRGDAVATAEEQCASAGEPAWNALTRGAVEAALRAQGNTPDAVTEITKRLDRYATTWTHVRRDACLAQARGLLAPAQATARTACLETRKTAFEVTAESLIDVPADITVIWRRTNSIPAPASCNSDDALRLSSGTTEHQALMRELAVAASSDGGNIYGKAIAAVAAKAAKTTDLPARLEVALVQASDAVENKRLIEADAALEVARPLVEQLDVGSTRVRAFALTARSYCLQGREEEANHFLAISIAGAQRLRESEAEAEMDELFLARTECMYRRRQMTELVPLLVDRIEYVRRRYGHDGPEEGDLRQRLGLVYYDMNRPDDGARETTTARRIFMRFTNANEAEAMAAYGASIEALQAGDLDGALAHDRRAIELFAAIHSADLGQVLAGYGMNLDTAQDRRAAIVAYSQAIDLLPEDSPEEPIRAKRAETVAARGHDRLLLGEYDSAILDLQAAIGAGEKLHRTDLVVEVQLSLGRAWVEKGEFERAVRILRPSLEQYPHMPTASRWRTGSTRFAFARALWATGDRANARTAAELAEKEVAITVEGARGTPLNTRFVPLAEAMLATIEKWRDEHH